MTSLHLSGYLALSKGRRISSENPSTRKTTQHMYYDTVIQTPGVDIPAQVRYWVPATEQPLPDGTVADVHAKLYAPPNATALLDATQFAAFPGDPTSATYEDGIPDRPFPTLTILGHTAGPAETMDDGVSLGYEVQCSEYLRDQNKSSRIYCRFDGSKPRWKKAPRPSQGAAVYVVGLAHGLHLNSGHIMVDVDQVYLNVGSAGSNAHSSPARVETGGVPSKRRRFPTTATSAAQGESSKSTANDTPMSEGVVLDADGGDVAAEAPGSSAGDSAASKKRSTAGRRKPASRRDENEEGEP